MQTFRKPKVNWVPGNHELRTLLNDPVQLRGKERYGYLARLPSRMTTAHDHSGGEARAHRYVFWYP